MRLLIVDDHAEFRAFAESLLGGEFEVVGDAADGESALTVTAQVHPDVVLLDVQLPGIDGIEVAERLAEMRDGPEVVLMSTRDASSYGGRLTSAPARGFIPKHHLSGAAITTVLNGTPCG